jgi:hypothetical protein
MKNWFKKEGAVADCVISAVGSDPPKVGFIQAFTSPVEKS